MSWELLVLFVLYCKKTKRGHSVIPFYTWNRNFPDKSSALWAFPLLGGPSWVLFSELSLKRSRSLSHAFQKIYADRPRTIFISVQRAARNPRTIFNFSGGWRARRAENRRLAARESSVQGKATNEKAKKNVFKQNPYTACLGASNFSE